MFNLFRRRGRRSSKEKEKQTRKNVTKPNEFTANLNINTATIPNTNINDGNVVAVENIVDNDNSSQKPNFLKNSASVLESKVNLDSTKVRLRRPKETPQKSLLNYHEYGDSVGGVVVSENSTNSRNEGADPLGQRRRSDNDNGDDQLKNQSNEKPAKRSKDKSSQSSSSNRRSIFFRHFHTTPPQPAPSENRYQQLDEDHPEFINETVKVTVGEEGTSSSSKKRFNPIEKGRELFNDILMAKGRHRNHRNHHHKNNNSNGGGQPSVAKVNQDSKKDYDYSKKTNPEQQHTYQISHKSKNTLERQNADGAAAAAAPTASVVASAAVSSVKCADSICDINNSLSAQNLLSKEKKRIEEDVTINESSNHNQTVSERASIQVHRKNASDDGENIEKIVAFETSEKQEEQEEDQKKRLESSKSDRVTASLNVEDLDNLSELTECDRDRFIVETTNTNNTGEMGQSQAKPSEPIEPVPVPKSRSSSPSIVREFRESHVADNQRPPSPQISSTAELVVPKIVVEDFGNIAEEVTTGNSSEKGDVFYDSENNRSAPPEVKIEDHLLKVPSEEDDQEEDEEDYEEEEEDQWHFVNNLLQQNPSSSVEGENSATNYQKAENSSDSNLSNSDSGIATASSSSSNTVPKVLLLESCDLVNDRSKDQSPHRYRDGSSTDCDENLPLCDDFDYYKDLPTIVDSVEVVSADDSHSGILIESISLPDVVVESTAQNVLNKNNNNSSDSSDHQHRLEDENVDNSENVKMGNVHFIPIRVEKRRSIDDSVLMTKSANGGNLLYNGQQYKEEKSTLVITAAEEEVVDEEAVKDAAAAKAAAVAEEEKHKKELVDQETHFNAQLDDAQKNIYNLQSKVDELQSKIDDLERELSAKSWNVERLQGELGAAHKEDEFVRRKLKLLEDEKTTLRQKSFETEEDLQRKYDDLDRQYKELDERYKEMKLLAGNLQTQYACAQTEAEQCRKETEDLRLEKDEQVRILEEALATAKQEQEAMQTKWHKEFESLRTQNADREESLMSDCEWQLRQMQKTCKDKIDKAEHQRKEAVERNQRIQEEAEEKLHEVEHLRSYEAEVKQLRGLTGEQENSIISMREQIEELKADLVTANENLEEQIECVRKIKYQCNNALYDKEREMLQKIDDVRNEAASLWENKLITEMTRLKMELESVYVDERREELDKLQAEHIEELKALTTRYTANEEELRAEISELRASLQQRNEEYANLREKSDNAILQTRMHLDRADRDYQTAMCREEEKRETLTESLRKELEAEKLAMEEKFRERLGQVQDEFNQELQTSTQELQEKHKRELEQQWQRLIAEKEEAIHEVEARHRKKVQDAEDRLHEVETRHQHNLKDLKLMYDSEKASLDKRDLSNTNEIEQLHRKCRCLTNLFEEMRMRYERRDPRPEDLREIAELRSRCEAQERDIFALTDRLRDMQIQLEELQNGGAGKKKSQVRKPPPKTIPTNCDVIYEENEERESPPPPPPRPMTSPNGHLDGEADDEDDDEEEEDDDDEEDDEEVSESSPYQKNTINDDDHPATIISNKKTNSLNLLNESII